MTEGMDILVGEVRELRAGIGTLGARVEALSYDFQKVNELTEKQQEVDRRSAAAVYEAAMAIQKVRELDAEMIPREEHEKRWAAEREKWREKEEELIDLRLRIRRRSFVQALTFFFLSCAVLAVTLVIVTDQLKEPCRDRVEASKKSVLAYERLLKSPTIAGDETLRGFMQANYEGAKRGAAVKC